jgi:hypothetical protein
MASPVLLVWLEHMHAEKGLLVKHFPLRGKSFNVSICTWDSHIFWALSEFGAMIPMQPTTPTFQSTSTNVQKGHIRLEEVEEWLGTHLHLVIRQPGHGQTGGFHYHFALHFLAWCCAGCYSPFTTQMKLITNLLLYLVSPFTLEKLHCKLILSIDIDTSSISTFNPDWPESDFSLILQLDSFTQPGLLEMQFKRLFTECQVCNMFMTQRTIPFHKCPPVVIDLTGDESCNSNEAASVSGVYLC